MAEAEQKEEVRRGVVDMLQKATNKTAQGAFSTAKTMGKVASFGIKTLSQARREPKVGAPGPEAGGVRDKAVVPFVPITLVCRDIRCAPRPRLGSSMCEPL